MIVLADRGPGVGGLGGSPFQRRQEHSHFYYYHFMLLTFCTLFLPAHINCSLSKVGADNQADIGHILYFV
jgi:hypothetical protein